MQSHLHFLRKGKLVLLRLPRPGLCVYKFFESKPEALLFQPHWSYKLQRRITTSATAGTFFEQDNQQEDRKFRRKPWRQIVASHRTRPGLPTPSGALGEYLDLKDTSERVDFVTRIAAHFDPSRLPFILLYHLHTNSTLDVSSASLNESFVVPAQNYLLRRGITADDIAHWCWILSGDGPDHMVERFYATSNPKPQFLLLEILRRDLQHVGSLNKILVHLLSKQENVVGWKIRIDASNTDFQSQENDNSFGVLISRLLHQARQIWPPALVSIAHMVEPYFHSIMDIATTPESRLSRYSRLSVLLNYIIGLLSLPAKANPLSSVRHNWKAQKVLLELASKFEPPLMLSQSSYRSVARSLAASRKSDVESRSAILRTRSWPPWRRDEDGMDAQRSLEEDFSRVISTLSKSQEAGYRKDDWDDELGIFGGMEPDGTPSIQTRRNLRKPRGHSKKGILSSQVWAARVEATRDVQEAWGAFLEFRSRGGTPQQDMFLAMFEKLNSHSAAIGRKSAYTAPPGDGKEVLPVSNDNYTDFYIERFQPPSLLMLYKEMLDMGIRPSGRCLNFLIRKARTTDEGLRFLLDAGIDPMAVRYLAEGSMSIAPQSKLQTIPERVLFAYIDLTCRLAPKAVIADTDRDSMQENGSSFPRFKFLETTDSNESGVVKHLAPTTWTILEQTPTSLRHLYTRETFNHVALLLKKSSTTFRPSWYVYFRALAKEGAVIAREVVGNPKWDSLAWLRLSAALKDFHSLGLELEPEGFHRICVGFEKFAGGPLGKLTRKYEGDAPEEAKTVRAAFARLSESQKESTILPRLFHTIRGVHLHAYIRALGSVDDHEGILSALEWMVEHSKELEAISQENRNGVLGFRKTIVAIRYILGDSEVEDRAKELTTTVAWWGNWPSDEDVLSYLQAPRDDFDEEYEEEDLEEDT